jgi:uncharacterized protein (DUF983 family)
LYKIVDKLFFYITGIGYIYRVIIKNLNNKSMANKSSNSGLSLTNLLVVLFIGLKLTGYITWSWVWVLSPLWISLLIAIPVIGISMRAQANKDSKKVNNRFQERLKNLKK